MKHNHSHLVVIVHCLLILGLNAEVQTVHICSTENARYDGDSDCVPFQSLFVQQTFLPGTSINFPNGTFTASDNNVSSSYNVIVRDSRNLTLTGDISGRTSIQCDGRLSFSFTNITNLTVSDIQFIGCGLPLYVGDVEAKTKLGLPEGIQAALFLHNLYSFFMTNIEITKSYGYGMLCVNVFAESYIVDTNFTLNHLLFDASPVGGSIFLLYQDDIFCQSSSTTSFSIINNLFLGSSAHHDTYEYSNFKASGLGIAFRQNSYFVYVVVNQTSFLKNHVPIVAMYDYNTTGSYELIVQGSKFVKSNSLEDLYHNAPGAAATILYTYIGNEQPGYTILSPQEKESASRNIHIFDCVFVDTFHGFRDDFGYIEIMASIHINITVESCVFLPEIEGSAITIQVGKKLQVNPKLVNIYITECAFISLDSSHRAISILSHKNNHMYIELTNCLFRNISGRVVKIKNDIKYHKDHLSVLIDNSSFIDNNNHALELFHVTNLTIAQSQFIKNHETPILCIGSRIFFRGSVYLIGNTGYNGGALYLQAEVKYYADSDTWKIMPSFLYMGPNVTLIVANNKATNKGGGIYVNINEVYHLTEGRDTTFDYNSYCFYQLVPKVRYHTSNLPKIYFVNNTAGYAGDSIYGGLDKECIIKFYTQRHKLDDIIDISHQLSPSEMADDPNMLCFCKGSTVDCTEVLLHLSLFQGQTVRLYAVATKVNNLHREHGATPALLNTWINPTSFYAQLGRDQSDTVHKLDNKCSEFKISIYSREVYVDVELQVSESDALNKLVKVSLLGCPLGFQLEDTEYPGCVCESIVKQSGCSCSIDDLIISCPLGKWIGNISGSVIVHDHCPLDYCRPGRDIKVDALGDQCTFNRSGILCGECQPGLSHVFGSSKCKECSDVYVILILPILLAGISFVIILYVCDLTVSRGTMNGLIYFANVVQFNSSIFITSLTPRILVGFIAWLNLDLGIETCFYSGMDMYAKAWLQLVFPVYMWLLVAAIVLLSRHSVKISRLTRDNTVPVLATLFVFSYAKLLRATIAVFSFTYINYPDGTYTIVWMYDGNVPYIKGKHTVLFMAALVAMIGFIMPYTVLLLLSPYLQMWSHQKPLRWVNKLKPFLDANHGPYKNKIRNWTGITLLIRAVQFTCFAANAEGDPSINLLLILVIGAVPHLLVWIFGSVHKSKINSILECAFVILLCTLGSASLYIRTTSLDEGGKQNVISTSIFGTAFCFFLVIMAYHTFIRMKSITSNRCAQRNILSTFIPKAEPSLVSVFKFESGMPLEPTVSYVSLSELKPNSVD